jgi:tetratricopeptide (TPR) repeat protein
LNTAVALDPDFGDAYGLLGLTLGFAGEKENAVASMKKAIQLNPRNEWNYFNLANVYMRSQDLDDALPLLQKLQSSSDPQIAMMAGQQFQSLQAYKESVDRWKQQSAAQQPGHAAPALVKRVGETNPNEEVAPQPVSQKPEPVLFLKGILNSVDCSQSPEAVLTVTSAGKKWKMLAPDAAKLIVMGADSLSCSWTNKRVAINYRKTGDHEGQLLSVELQ